jgi:predicted permease
VRVRIQVVYWQDIKYAFRLLAKSPLFTILTVIVLAGGLGLSIFTFSFLHTAMLKPLPVQEGERVVRLLATGGTGASGMIDAADLAGIRPNVTVLTDLGVYTGRELIVGTGEGVRSIQATATEWNLFRASRASPLLGRGFRPDDQEPGAEPVVVLSHWAWRVVFGADTGLIDRHALMNGVSTRVIGVMPEGYGFPVAAEAWVPIRAELLRATLPNQEWVEAYARLAPGADAARATAELTGLIRRVQDARLPRASSDRGPTGLTVSSFPMAQIGEEAPLALVVLNTLAALILLLACINVTNLLLARANERARETAVRLALGAPRARLIMQSMWESIILCLAGGVLATGLAVWGLDAVNAWTRSRLEGNLAFWWVWGFDRTVLLSAGGFVTLAIAVLGLVVSMRAARTEINAVLQDDGSRAGERREGRMARALVVVQVATVSLLMFFGSMSAIVAHRVANLDLGYDTDNLLSASVELPDARYPDAGSRGRFYQGLYERLAARPELDGVMLRASLAAITEESGEFELGDRPSGGVRPRTFLQAVLGPLTPLGIALREGRFFDSRDTEGSAGTVIVSQALADRYWPGRSPIGARLRMVGLGETSDWRTVVGVVGNVLLGNPLSRDRSPIAAYIPLRQTEVQGSAVVFRHRGSRAAGQGAFHQTFSDLDPLMAPGTVASFDEMLGKTTLIAKSVAALFGACFAFALLLALSGTYGLMARAIGRRTREIGLRRALGATDRTILLLLLGQGGRQLGIGAIIALPLTLLVGWGFSRYFPIALSVSVGTALGVSAAITALVLAATWLPTRRAIAIEPRDALWRE